MESKNKKKRCRVCIRPDKSTKLLSINYKRTDGKIVDLLNYLFGCLIHHNDKLPQSICTNCYSKLKSGCELKLNFLKSDLELKRELVEQETLKDSCESENFVAMKFQPEIEPIDDLSKVLVKCEPLDIADPFDENLLSIIKMEEEMVLETVDDFQNYWDGEDNVPSPSETSVETKNAKTIRETRAEQRRLKKEKVDDLEPKLDMKPKISEDLSQNILEVNAKRKNPIKNQKIRKKGLSKRERIKKTKEYFENQKKTELRAKNGKKPIRKKPEVTYEETIDELSLPDENSDKDEDFTLESLKDDVNEHNKKAHSKTGRYKCFEKFDDSNDLKAHIKRLHTLTKDKNARNCFICNKKYFSSECLLHDHLKKMHGNDEKCTSCDYVSLKPRLLNLHIYRTHIKMKKPEEPKNFVCEQCGNKEGTEFKLKYHINRKHAMIELLKCKECPKEFKYLSNLHSHIVSRHKGGFLCDLCNKRFAGKPSLIFHFQRLHGVKARSKCPSCQNIFSSNPALTKHQAKYRGDCVTRYITDRRRKPGFKCPYCPTIFRYKNSMHEAHINAHLNLKPYSCEKCQMAFSGQISLRNHKFSCENLRSFHCSYENCEERFNKNDHLKTHVAFVHTKEPRYICKICGATFVKNKEHGRHMRKQHGVRKAPNKIQIVTDATTQINE